MAEVKTKTSKAIKEKVESKIKENKIESKPQLKPVQKKTGLEVDVYDLSGKAIEKMMLAKEIFGVKVNKRLLAQAVRVYLANQRAGSASTKTRGEVRGSTRKIYRQKGTGRARHGGVRAPIFVHGGIAHGPKPKDYSLKLSQKMKKAALFSALSAKMLSGEIKVVAGLEKIAPKTKSMNSLLTQINIGSKNKRVLLVIDGEKDSVIRASKNISGVTYDYVNKLFAYEVLNAQNLVFMKEAIDKLVTDINSKAKKV